MEPMELPFSAEPDFAVSPFSISSNWLPAVDSDWFTSDDFNSMFESTIGGCGPQPAHGTAPACVESERAATSDVSACTVEPPASEMDCKGLRSVHLLMAAAEEMAGGEKEGEDLAWVILMRLRELVSPGEGTNIERLAGHFTQGLHNVLEGSASPRPGSSPPASPFEFLAAFQLLQQMSPYIKFGHFLANQAIIEAVRFERGVHIIDYDIMEGSQWPPLMQALVHREGGPPQRLRITAITRPNDRRRPFVSTGDTGRRLASFAASVGQPFSFHQCRLDQEERLRPGSVKLFKGEVLLVNCMLHLPHSTNHSPASVQSLLSSAHKFHSKPRLVTLVEDELLGSTYGEGHLLGRFMDLLHNYSAIYDSLEASCPSQGRPWGLVESALLGPKIEGSLACLFDKTQAQGSKCSEWMMESFSFQPQPISTFNHCQAKLLLGLFNDGYRAVVYGNKVLLEWKGRRLLTASIWSPST
ncbi:protein NODULATION SIGNALING PATHWAY 2 [Nymphaea colorata]|uniref:protein NODULATION SIGNALING PATHWAY 2 n=1 Tax=Nymphaea colorata TaxID=210225 RepID=UPI00129ECBC3|nr:protein NODULATION SIGNALING PATHWAY 2 [Nymphaea colorata]